MGNLFLALIFSLDSSNYGVRQRSEQALLLMPWLESDMRRILDGPVSLEMKVRGEKILQRWDDQNTLILSRTAPQEGKWYCFEIDGWIKAPLTGQTIYGVWFYAYVEKVEKRQAWVRYQDSYRGPRWTPIEWPRWKRTEQSAAAPWAIIMP